LSSELHHQRWSESSPAPGGAGLLRAAPPRKSRSIKLSDLETRQHAFCPLPARIAAGTRIDDFVVLEEAGGGGAASVYRARQESRERQVALKVLSPHLITVSDAVSRFFEEAELGERLAHPGIVPTYSHGFDSGYHYYAMRWMDSPTLAEAQLGAPEIRDDTFFRDAAVLFAYLSRTAAFLHSNGIVHRDLKPSNLFLVEGDRVLISDFGVAADVDKERSRQSSAGSGAGPETAARLRHSVLGTPAYMAPERFLSREASLDPRGDIYSIGISLYEFACGAQPFLDEDPNDEEIVRRKLTRKLPSPRRLAPQLPLGLEAIIRQATETHPGLRYQSADELARDLERFASSRRTRTRFHPSSGLPWGFGEPDDDGDPDPQPALLS
jgi:serine/threonine protein kinase